MGVIAKGIPRGCQGLFTPVSLGYPLSVLNKNSTLKPKLPLEILPHGGLHFTQPGLLMPAAAGVVDERGSEYILAHTGPRELDGHPLGCGSGFCLVSGYTTPSIRIRANI